MNVLAAWLLTVLVQGSALLLLAAAIDGTLPRQRLTWRELVWRTALVGGVLTATLQFGAGYLPLAGRWPVRAPAAHVDPAPLPQDTAPLPRAMAPANAPSATPLVSARADAMPGEPRAWDWPLGVVALWLIGAAIAAARTAGSVAKLRRALATATPVAGDALAAALHELAARARGPRPKLARLAGIPSPIAARGDLIVVPAWAGETLEPAQLRAMLAHELAHLARRDPQWKLAIALWRVPFWFLPAGRALRRLDELAELACDACAAQSLGDAHGLVECLAACAERHTRAPALRLAPAMAAHRSSLLVRIDRLLEGVSMDTATAGAAARLVAVVALATGAFCLPAIGFETARAASPPPAAPKTSQSSISIHADDEGGGHTIVSQSDATHKFRADIDGKMALSADETDVASIDGTARLEQTRDGVSQRIDLTARNGAIERRFFVDGTERPYDDRARAFMASAVKQLVRSGIDAEARAKRLFAAGGAQRVLDEIDAIPSDYVRRVYLVELSKAGKLTAAELDRALADAGGMTSDYERRQTLDALFGTQAFDAPRDVTLLAQGARFSSDYERAELLVAALPRLVDAPQVRQAWLDAALGIRSDYERRRTLEAALTRGGLADAQLEAILDASRSFGSDYERRELLTSTAKRIHDLDAVAPAYVRSTQQIGSDYERREALLALIKAGKLGTSGAAAVLDSAAQIRSPYECSQVLVALARELPDDAALVARYHDVAQRLPDAERDAAERALGRWAM